MSAPAGPAVGLIPHGRPLLVRPRTRRFLPGRAPWTGRGPAQRPPRTGRSTPWGRPARGAGAVGTWNVSSAPWRGSSPGGSRVSLLEIRLVPEEASIRRGYEGNASLGRRVFTAITSGPPRRAIPETIDASPARAPSTQSWTCCGTRRTSPAPGRLARDPEGDPLLRPRPRPRRRPRGHEGPGPGAQRLRGPPRREA